MRSPSELTRVTRLLLDSMDRATAWRLAGTNALAITGGFIAGLAPLALKGVVDAAGSKPMNPGQSAGQSAWMVTLALAYLLCLGAGRLIAEMRPTFASAAEQCLYGRLRLRFFQHTLQLPLAFQLDMRSGAIVHALQLGISGYQVILFSLVNSIIPVLFEGLF